MLYYAISNLLQFACAIKVICPFENCSNSKVTGTVQFGWATIDPPTIDPPTIDPPTIDPPTIYPRQLTPRQLTPRQLTPDN